MIFSPTYEKYDVRHQEVRPLLQYFVDGSEIRLTTKDDNFVPII